MKQAVLSLVSLLLLYGKKPPVFDIIVFTDMPERFEWLKTQLPLNVRLLTRDQIPELSGPHGFVLRAKIALMAKIHSETKRNLLFIDTDTILRGRLEKIFFRMEAGNCFLHKREWPLRKGRKLNPELCPQDLAFTLESGNKIQITGKTQMWNSGVVGIPESRGDLLRDALDFCDQYYKIYPGWHVEQFSLSIILQKTGRLLGCRQKIFHYWHSKKIANETISKVNQMLPSDYIKDASLMGTSRIIAAFVLNARVQYYIHRLRLSLSKNRIIYDVYCLFKRSNSH